MPGRCLRHTLLNSTYPPRHAPSGPRCPGSEIDKSRPAEGLSARGSRSAREGDGLRGDGGYPPFFCGSLSLACIHSGRKRRAEGAFVVRGVGESGVYNTLPFFFPIFYLFYLTMTAIWMGLCLNRFFIMRGYKWQVYIASNRRRLEIPKIHTVAPLPSQRRPIKSMPAE